jgi:hypothetical protein
MISASLRGSSVTKTLGLPVVSCAKEDGATMQKTRRILRHSFMTKFSIRVFSVQSPDLGRTHRQQQSRKLLLA